MNSENSYNVLIVEDDEQLRDSLSRALRHHGYRTRGASRSTDALALAKELQPDLIVCDYNLADSDCWSLLDGLRNEDGLEACPFIVMTGDRTRASYRSSMNFGADDHLEKPFSLDTFLGCVAARLKRSKTMKRSEEKVAMELRSTLTKSLPHEFLTPLNGIIGFSEILTCEEYEATEVKEIAQTINECGKRLLRTIQNYLAILEVINSPALPNSAAAKVSAMEIIQAVESHSMAIAEDYSRMADLDSDSGLGPVELLSIDVKRVVGVLHELVDNAFKFSKRGSTVIVRLASKGGILSLTVTDSGSGMSRQQIDQIGIFRQFDRARLAQDGLGLGLALANQVLAKQGGTLSIESVLGMGTTVTASWPSVDAPSVAERNLLDQTPAADGPGSN